jgi:hypothetical protein
MLNIAMISLAALCDSCRGQIVACLHSTASTAPSADFVREFYRTSVTADGSLQSGFRNPVWKYGVLVAPLHRSFAGRTSGIQGQVPNLTLDTCKLYPAWQSLTQSSHTPILAVPMRRSELRLHRRVWLAVEFLCVTQVRPGLL